MRFASVAEVKNHLSAYLARARKKREPIVVTHHGRPYALIQPISERDLERLEWDRLARQRLEAAWETSCHLSLAPTPERTGTSTRSERSGAHGRDAISPLERA